MSTELPTLIQGGLAALVCVVIGWLLADHNLERKLTRVVKKAKKAKKKARQTQRQERRDTV